MGRRVGVKLTKRRVDAARYEEGDGRPSILWDTELAGFRLRVYPSGAKAYVLRYRTPCRTEAPEPWITPREGKAGSTPASGHRTNRLGSGPRSE